MSQYQKLLSAQELKIEQKREIRHSLLQQCKMEDINLPFIDSGVSETDDVSGYDVIDHLYKLHLVTVVVTRDW